MNVGEGETVAVSVGKRVWVGKAIRVGEGYGLAVQVGSMTTVGAGFAKIVNPPHPIDKKARREMRTKGFLKPIKDD
jgi:hypothetical protein